LASSHAVTASPTVTARIRKTDRSSFLAGKGAGAYHAPHPGVAQASDDEVSIYCANKAMQLLKAALALRGRGPRVPASGDADRASAQRARRARPSSPPRGRKAPTAARDDVVNGVYVAFRSLAGTRHRALGLMWDTSLRGECHPQFERNPACATVFASRVQQRPRPACVDIQMSPLLREDVALPGASAAPRNEGELERGGFPPSASPEPGPLPRAGGGGSLIYGNFRKRLLVERR